LKLGVFLLATLWVTSVTAQTLDLDARRANRRVSLTWSAVAEVDDALFGGYDVWRAIVPDPEGFALLRRFERRYPVAWTYCGTTPFPVCDQPSASTQRAFVDADSIVTFRKFQVTALGDSAITREYLGIPPHNGFPYFYAVTWFSECLDDRNDTLRVYQPQPEIFEFQQGDETHYGFLGADGDTLRVQRVECFEIDELTNRPIGDPVPVFRGTEESEEALRFHAIDATRTPNPIFPSTTPEPDLQNVRVIPNPYELSAPWDEPDRRKVQFVNLTGRATVRVFTLAGDLVRRIEHPQPGSPPDQGSADWDLKNADGRLVQPGLYIWNVEAPDRVVTATGKLAIIY
jgi:hypothetical protein